METVRNTYMSLKLKTDENQIKGEQAGIKKEKSTQSILFQNKNFF